MAHMLSFGIDKTVPKRKVIRTDKYWIYYDDNTRDIDLWNGSTSFTLGYSATKVHQEISRGTELVTRAIANTFETIDEIDEFSEVICNTGNFEAVQYTNCGTTAVEAAIAMSDAYWKQHEEDKPLILSFTPGWHGTSALTKSLGMPPLNTTPSNRHIYGSSIENIETGLADELPRIGCIIIETVPWYRGWIEWHPNEWKKLREICDKHHILMITDDVMCGWGKSHEYHGYKSFGYGYQPDISALAKSLCAGYVPLGAAVCNKKVSDVISNNWKHGHTVQPSTGGICGALEAYKHIEERNLLDKVHWIQPMLETLATTLLNKEIITDYKTSGTVLFMNFTNDIRQSGMSNRKQLRVCAPLIADDEYFETINNKILTMYNQEKT
tara:strand:- start:79 stop:1224 length:1146 start_codon:yes stop_codon:yes gene_type:complete